VLTADVEVDRRDLTIRADLRVADGERVALFGPSGAGKTTVLEAIAGLVEPRLGLVELRGRVLTDRRAGARVVAVPPWQRRVGLLRQDPGLFPHLSVRANLTYGRPRGASGGGGIGELDALAGELGIVGLLSAMPARLSGGQRHRVALGRLLLARCDALLLDEPFSALDAALRRALTALVRDLAAERQVPTILVTHQLADAQAFADLLAVMDHGVFLQVGAPDRVVLRPATRRVAELVGYLGFVPVTGAQAIGTAGGEEGLVAGVHPDRVVPGADPARGLVVTGTVVAARPSGAGWEADLRAGDAPFTCRLPDRPPTAELPVTVLDPPVFAADGRLAPAGTLPETLPWHSRALN
jgi:ABC-type sulfate/molybdate transport systems ATPase subunit